MPCTHPGLEVQVQARLRSLAGLHFPVVVAAVVWYSTALVVEVQQPRLRPLAELHFFLVVAVV